MPRPGPRPFECVRKAWHSDMHQPIRGSLIQEILRVVNETHSSETRSNREWQEKLPIVVLKAEEIMYSKANSEAEYTDLSTVWDRANDAINTIIRLDESTETGELLQPCIEAALVLGSVPRTPSRSQRNYNPRCYLNPTSKPESVYVASTSSLKKVDHITNTSPFLGSNSNLQKHDQTTKTSHSWSQNVSRCLPKQANTSNSCSIHPVYYGSPLQSQLTPITLSENPEIATTNHLQNLSLCDLDAPENRPGVECDLSLRLGLLSSPSTSMKSSFPREVEGFGSGTCQEKSRPSDLTLPMMGEEFSFFPIREDNKLLGAENDAEISIKKRKMPHSSVQEDRYSYWQPKLPCNQNHAKSRNTGL